MNIQRNHQSRESFSWTSWLVMQYSTVEYAISSYFDFSSLLTHILTSLLYLMRSSNPRVSEFGSKVIYILNNYKFIFILEKDQKIKSRTSVSLSNFSWMNLRLADLTKSLKWGLHQLIQIPRFSRSWRKCRLWLAENSCLQNYKRYLISKIGGLIWHVAGILMML